MSSWKFIAIAGGGALVVGGGYLVFKVLTTSSPPPVEKPKKKGALEKMVFLDIWRVSDRESREYFWSRM